MTSYNIPKYEPICGNCGHTSSYHDYVSCTHKTVLNLNDNTGYKECKCPKWQQYTGWPKAIIVEK